MSSDRIAMSSNSFFHEGRGLCNSHEMRLFVQKGMGLLNLLFFELILPIQGSNKVRLPVYASMFWFTLAGDSTSFWCGVELWIP